HDIFFLSLYHMFFFVFSPKEKDKSIIQCLECCGKNLYIGTKDSTVQHLLLPSLTNEPQSPRDTREGRLRKLGSSHPVVQLRAIPIFNHLLVLWDRSVTALNMFSLEPIPALKKIQHVSLFELCDLTNQSEAVEMVTCSSRRKVIRIHIVGVDKWEVVKEITLPQDPVALAVDGGSLCVATSDRYLLCDLNTGNSNELFPHSHSRQHVVVTSVGRGEFLLNGPESLGLFVMKTGICQRPPLQWPQEVLAAGVCFPYILTLQPQVLSVYSMLDQQRKHTVSLSGAKGLLSTSDGVLVFTERDIFSLCLVPIEEQIQTLVGHERADEALLLLEGVQSHRPLDSHKELQKAITCLAGFVHFYQEGFSEAKDLFIKGELDPREIISLYPDVKSCLSADFQSHLDQVNKHRDLEVLWQEDRNTFYHYQAFLGDFLRGVRETQQDLRCRKEVDCALLWLYAEQDDTGNLLQLVTFPNECCLDQCVPVLQQHKRFFALGLLYQSHGEHSEALQTWVKIADGLLTDPTCSDVYEHIVSTLSQLINKDVVWAFADWVLRRNQETGVQIFTKWPPDNQFSTQDVLVLLEAYPQAMMLYLEFLIHDLHSKEERHHSHLALAYVTHTQQEEEEAKSNLTATREKLQQLLWDSAFYDISIIFVKSTSLHMEKAILLGKAGEHFQALQLLAHHERDPQAAEAYCDRFSQGQDPEYRQTLLSTLLKVYLNSEGLTSAAVDLLNNNPQVFATEKVVQVLPESWSVQLVSQFLVGSLRETFHQTRMRRLQKALAQAELFRHKVIWMQASKTAFKVHKGQVCKVCQKDLTEPQFICNLQGELIHTTCTAFSAL
uniref:Si:ch211-266g18.9 n=1 Tax=Sphaeramia orbicularis TaxID=375764 RepID=A0A673CRG6_9TELE